MVTSQAVSVRQTIVHPLALCFRAQSRLFLVAVNKLSYRRDRACRRSLRRSRSFKVTDVSTSRKPVCDFLLVNNTNLHSVSHRFSVIAQYWSNYRLSYRVPLVNALVLGNLCECRYKSYLLIYLSVCLSVCLSVYLSIIYVLFIYLCIYCWKLASLDYTFSSQIVYGSSCNKFDVGSFQMWRIKCNDAK